MLRPRVHSTSCVLIFIFIVLFQSASANDGNTPRETDMIHWKLMTKPVYFGHDVDLVCIIKTDDTSEPMAWIRMPKGEAIAYNDIPTDDTKYRIGVQYNNTNLVYTLTIKQFNSTDVNRAYRCDFGFYSYTDRLLLNDRDFSSKPSNTDMKSEFSLTDETLIGRVKIENVFPRPMCKCIFQNMNISEFMTIRYTNTSIFFNTTIEIQYSTDICGGSVNVTCTYGDNYLYFNELVGGCSEKSYWELTVVLPIIGILLVVSVLLVLLIRMRRRISSCKLGLKSQMNAANDKRKNEDVHCNENIELIEISEPDTVSTITDSGIGLSTTDNEQEMHKAIEQKESSEMLLKD